MHSARLRHLEAEPERADGFTRKQAVDVVQEFRVISGASFACNPDPFASAGGINKTLIERRIGIPTDLSILFRTRSCVFSLRSLRATAWMCAQCAAAASDEASTTCRRNDASVTSSSVARKASTRVVGRSRINPTVSLRSTRRFLGSTSWRTVGSRVANSSGASAITPAPVSLSAKSVDFPVLGISDERYRLKRQRSDACGAECRGSFEPWRVPR